MKTRRNHRKTTNSRRRRVVKQQRGQTRIHYRKGTVSSGRRHRFFKRGGEPVVDPTIKAIVDGIETTVKTKLEIGSDVNLKLDVDLISYDDNSSIPTTSTPLLFDFQGKKIKFVIVKLKSNSNQSVYIYMYDTSEMKYILYGKVMVTIDKNNMGSYYPDVATAIFNAINLKPDLQQYKQKQ